MTKSSNHTLSLHRPTSNSLTSGRNTVPLELRTQLPIPILSSQLYPHSLGSADCVLISATNRLSLYSLGSDPMENTVFSYCCKGVLPLNYLANILSSDHIGNTSSAVLLATCVLWACVASHCLAVCHNVKSCGLTWNKKSECHNGSTPAISDSNSLSLF